MHGQTHCPELAGIAHVVGPEGEITCWDSVDEAPQLAQALAEGFIRVEEDHPLWDCTTMGNRTCEVQTSSTTLSRDELAYTGDHTMLLASLAFAAIAVGTSLRNVARRLA